MISYKSRFVKLFISYFMLIVIPTIIISFIFLNNTLNRIKNEHVETNLARLHALSNGIETIVYSVENMSMQFSLLPSLNKVLNDPIKSSMYDYSLLRQDLQNFTFTNKMIYSLYVYFNVSDKVYTTNEGFYPRESFYDKHIVDQANANSSKWYTARQVADSVYENVESGNIITFSRTIPVMDSYAMGSMIINLREEIFFDALNKLKSNNIEETIIADDKGQVITNGKKELIIGGVEQKTIPVDDLVLNEGMTVVKLNNVKYYMAYYKSSYNNWIYINLIPYDSIAGNLRREKTIVIRLMFVILCIGLIPSYYFSKKMYAPLINVLNKLNIYFNALEYEGIDKQDEYSAIHCAVEDLIQDNKNIRGILDRNKQILREKLVQDLLWGNVNNQEELNEKMSYSDIQFNFPYFMCMIIFVNEIKDIRNIKLRDEGRLYIKNIVEAMFCSEGYYVIGVLFEEEKISFIINIEEAEGNLKKRFSKICKEVDQEIKNDISLSLSFSFGPIIHGITKIYDSFFHAKKNLNFLSVTDEEDIMFHVEHENNIIYPVNLQRRIINGIMAYNKQTIDDAVEEFFNQYIECKSYSYNQVQQTIIIMLSCVAGEVWQEGVDFNVSDITPVFEKVVECENSKKLKELMKTSFKDIITNISSNVDVQQNDYIEQVTKFIKENYTRDISASDIADHVKLNRIYLNRIFKIKTGKTLIEYLTLWRLEKAKELFETDKRLSLNEISSMLGYNSVHSFIRFFKKYEGITPGEYRSNMK